MISCPSCYAELPAAEVGRHLLTTCAGVPPMMPSRSPSLLSSARSTESKPHGKTGLSLYNALNASSAASRAFPTAQEEDGAPAWKRWSALFDEQVMSQYRAPPSSGLVAAIAQPSQPSDVHQTALEARIERLEAGQQRLLDVLEELVSQHNSASREQITERGVHSHTLAFDADHMLEAAAPVEGAACLHDVRPAHVPFVHVTTPPRPVRDAAPHRSRVEPSKFDDENTFYSDILLLPPAEQLDTFVNAPPTTTTTPTSTCILDNSYHLHQPQRHSIDCIFDRLKESLSAATHKTEWV